MAELPAPALAACRRGDGSAFRALVECYQDRVYALCVALAGRADAEDLAQETFLRVHQAIGRFDPAGSATLGGWILTIARRLCHDRARSARLRIEVASGAGLETAASDAQPGGGGRGGEPGGGACTGRSPPCRRSSARSSRCASGTGSSTRRSRRSRACPSARCDRGCRGRARRCAPRSAGWAWAWAWARRRYRSRRSEGHDPEQGSREAMTNGPRFFDEAALDDVRAAGGPAGAGDALAQGARGRGCGRGGAPASAPLADGNGWHRGGAGPGRRGALHPAHAIDPGLGTSRALSIAAVVLDQGRRWALACSGRGRGRHPAGRPCGRAAADRVHADGGGGGQRTDRKRGRRLRARARAGRAPDRGGRAHAARRHGAPGRRWHRRDDPARADPHARTGC